MTSPQWHQACLALRLLALDPSGCGGIWLRARMGPVRERFVALARDILGNSVRVIHPSISDEALLGGLDLTATLSTGQPVHTSGILDCASPLFLTNAERCSLRLAALLGQALDQGKMAGLLLLDEGLEDETAPKALTDRLSFHLNLDGLRLEDCPFPEFPHAPDRGRVNIPTEHLRALVSVASSLGVSGLRGPLFAARAARLSASLTGCSEISEKDLDVAIALVLAPRATQIPEPPENEAPQDDKTGEQNEETSQSTSEVLPLDDVLLEAALASLPPDLLAQLKSGSLQARSSGFSAQGAKQKGNQRGRPLPPRSGRMDGRSRIDLIATLRAAAPWQAMRAEKSEARRVQIRPSDIHLKRFQDRSDRLLIFAVDASGSAAINRLAEAKGAIELLLAEAYSKRDHISLISYSKETAELILPPTRSLVQTKKRLSDLPGGGGTPLAMGLKEAIETALWAGRKGFQPALILVADGRTNIDLSGQADRARAFEDAKSMAKHARALQIPGILIDMSKRPEAQLKTLAEEMEAAYVPLPFADARKLSQVVTSGLEAG